MRLIAGLVGAGLVTSIVAQGCSAKHCSSNAECSSGEMCLYPIGDCSASGECQKVSNPPTRGCSTLSCAGGETQYCGCDGTTVYGGACGFPDGYATGPTRGQGDDSCFAYDAGTPDVYAATPEAASDAGSGSQAEAAPPMACAIPPEADASVDDAGGSCAPNALLGLDGAPSCPSGAYGIMCISAASSPPTPAPSLQCSVLPIPPSHGIAYYCCPCGD